MAGIFERYNKNANEARIEKADVDRLAKLEEDLHFRFVPVNVPMEKTKKVDPTFFVPEGKGETMNNFLKAHFLQSLEKGKEIVVEVNSKGGSLMPISDELIKSGAKEIHLNFPDAEKYILQKELQEGGLDGAVKAMDGAYSEIIEHVEEALLQSKNTEVRRIMRAYQKAGLDGGIGSKKFQDWYKKEGYPTLAQGGKVYEAVQKLAQKTMNEPKESFANPTDLEGSARVAMLNKMLLHGTGQPFVGTKGWGNTEGHLKKFKRLFKRDAVNFEMAKKKGVDVSIYGEDIETNIKNLSEEFRGRGITDKVVGYVDPPYMRTTRKKKVEGLEDYTHKEGLRRVFKPFLKDIEDGMDLMLTNDLDPDYIEAVIGRTSRFNTNVYTYKEGATPTSLITTQMVADFERKHGDIKNAKLLPGNVDVKSTRGKELIEEAIKERLEKAGFEGNIRDFVKATKGQTKVVPAAYKRIINKRLQSYEKAAGEANTVAQFMGNSHEVVKEDLYEQNNRMAGIFLRDFEEYQKIEPKLDEIIKESTDEAGHIRKRTRLDWHESEALDIKLNREGGRKIAKHQVKVNADRAKLREAELEYAQLEQAHLGGSKRVPKDEGNLFKTQTADLRKKIATLRANLSRSENPMNMPVFSQMEEFKTFFGYLKDERKWLDNFYNTNLKGLRTETFSRDAKTNEDIFAEQFGHMDEAMSGFQNYKNRKEAFDYYKGEFDTFVRNIIDIETAPRKRSKPKKPITLPEYKVYEEPAEMIGKIKTFDELVEKRLSEAGFLGGSEQFFRTAKGLDQPSLPPQNWVETKLPELEGYKFPE